jgi:hypothetical protein
MPRARRACSIFAGCVMGGLEGHDRRGTPAHDVTVEARLGVAQAGATRKEVKDNRSKEFGRQLRVIFKQWEDGVE